MQFFDVLPRMSLTVRHVFSETLHLLGLHYSLKSISAETMVPCMPSKRLDRRNVA